MYAPGGADLPLQIVATQDAGATWRVVDASPADGADPTSFPSVLFVDLQDGVAYNGSGLFATHHGGKAWERVDLPGRVLHVSNYGQSLWATYTSCPESPTTTPCGAGAEVSGDAGRSWTKVTVAPAPYRDAEVAFDASGTVYLGLWAPASGQTDPGQLLVSHDDGASWGRYPLPCPQGYRVGGQVSVASSPATIWLVCAGQGSGGTRGVVIFRSIDGGLSWIGESSYALGGPTGVREGAPGGQLEQLVATSPETALALTVNQGLMRSTDGGVTWQPVPSRAMETNISSFLGTLDVVDPTHAWVGCWITVAGARGLWRTTDAGMTWQPLSPVNR